MKTLLIVTLALFSTFSLSAADAAKPKKDVVMIVATHPDDLAISLGFCHLAKDFYDLHVVDYTHGERGCGEEKFRSGWTKATRTKEEESVCRTINAKLHWLDEVDGEAYAGRETCHRLANLIKELQPRAVIGHWPVDIHTDHVMAGAAMLRAVFLSGVKCEVWFSEQTYQSKRWTPDVFVDVTSVMDDVVKSLNLYVCQLQGGAMVEHQKLARRFYGFQSRKFYDGYCEGYKSLIAPMAGDRTIFTDLPKAKGFCEHFEFEGVREESFTNPVVKCPALDKTYLIGEAVGKDSPYYKVGEEIVYSMKLRGVGEGLRADDWKVVWTRTGDDGVVEKGTAALPLEEPLVIRTKSTKPGSVKVEAKLVGPDGKVYNKQGCRDWEKYIFFTGTALVEPEKVARVEEPADFDAFWKGVKAKLAAVPMEVLERRQIKADGPNGDVFAIKVACAGARPVTGYLSLPKSRKPGEKFPAKVEFDGYGCGKMRPYDGGLGQREILFHINAHGFDLEKDDQYYSDFNKSIGLDNTSYAFSEKQNAKPESAYFYGMTLRVMRALEFVKSLPEWDGKNLVSSGGSQGGLQSVWAAGLDPDVTEVFSEITWCCDLGGEKLGRIRGGWYIKGTDALRYFDPVNHAKRINPKAKFACRRAGLGDYTCPPMGLWMLYNAVPCAKSIRWVQGSTHGTVPPNPNQAFDESRE